MPDAEVRLGNSCVLLVLTLVVGCLFVVFPAQINPAWVLIGLVVVLVVDFWVRYAVITTAKASA